MQFQTVTHVPGIDPRPRIADALSRNGIVVLLTALAF
jgi:hypothetical protein